MTKPKKSEPDLALEARIKELRGLNQANCKVVEVKTKARIDAIAKEKKQQKFQNQHSKQVVSSLKHDGLICRARDKEAFNLVMSLARLVMEFNKFVKDIAWQSRLSEAIYYEI